jgi:hypothetical protein
MKAIKFLVAAVAMAFAVNANAKIFEDNHFTLNANLGGIVGAYGYSEGGFGLGAGFQTGVLDSKYVSLAWDVAQIEWNAPFNSPGDSDWLNFRSGIRAFSPSFANDHLRAYMNFGLGYTLVLAKGWAGDDVDLDDWYDDLYDDDWYDWDDIYDDLDDGVEMKAHSAFGLNWGFGIQLNKKFSLGYSLHYDTYSECKKHFVTFGFTF